MSYQVWLEGDKLVYYGDSYAQALIVYKEFPKRRRRMLECKTIKKDDGETKISKG